MGVFNILTPKEEVREVRQIQQEKKYKFLGNARKVKGLRLYEVEIASLNICLAVPVKTEKVVIGEHSRKRGVRNKEYYVFKDDHLYIQAMNEENALRKAKTFIKEHNIVLRKDAQ